MNQKYLSASGRRWPAPPKSVRLAVRVEGGYAQEVAKHITFSKNGFVYINRRRYEFYRIWAEEPNFPAEVVLTRRTQYYCGHLESARYIPLAAWVERFGEGEKTDEKS